jgi:hypothetical protein
MVAEAAHDSILAKGSTYPCRLGHWEGSGLVRWSRGSSAKHWGRQGHEIAAPKGEAWAVGAAGRARVTTAHAWILLRCVSTWSWGVSLGPECLAQAAGVRCSGERSVMSEPQHQDI